MNGIGIVRFPNVHVRLSEIWELTDDEKEYIIEVWKCGVKVDLEKAKIHDDNDWRLLQREIKIEIGNAILNYITVLKNDYNNLKG